MSAPLRVKPHPAARPTLAAGGPADPLKDYLDRIVKMIPAGVVGLYLVGSGIVPQDSLAGHLIWVAVCLAAVFLVQIYGTSDKLAGVPPETGKIIIAAVAFLIWVYTLGQPWLRATGLYVQFLASLFLLAWTFFVPIFYK